MQLADDLLRGERLPLDDVEPLPERLQPLASAGAGVELKCSIMPIRLVGIPIWIRSSMRVAHPPRSRRLPRTAPCFATDGPLRSRPRGRGRRPATPAATSRRPPRRACTAGSGAAGTAARRARRGVAGARARWRGTARWSASTASAGLRAGELVHRDQRVVAARRGDGGVEELVRTRLDRRRVGRLRRRADAILQIEVEVDGLRALRAQLRRDDEVRRGADDPGPREDRRPERHHARRRSRPRAAAPAAARTGAGPARRRAAAPRQSERPAPSNDNEPASRGPLCRARQVSDTKGVRRPRRSVVERGVDLRDLLGLAGFVAHRLVGARLAAEATRAPPKSIELPSWPISSSACSSVSRS